MSLLKQIEQTVDATLDGIRLPQLFDDSLVFKKLELLDFPKECTYEATSMCDWAIVVICLPTNWTP